MTIHQLELSWIQHLQNALRGPLTDTFFIYWNYVDSIWFVLSFVAAIMYLFDRKEGISLLFIFISSSIVNTLLKEYFHLPRPCQIDPSVGLLCYKTFGFPSGAAQTATLIIGIAFTKCRKNIYKIVAALFAFFLYFSRIYLGVHYFTDILGGIAVGIILLAIYLKLFPLVENHWEKFGFGLFLLLLAFGTKMLPQATMMLGIAIGLELAKKAKLSTSWPTRIASFLVVVIGTTALIYLGEIYPNIKPLATLLAGFWITCFGNYLASIQI